MEGAPRGRCDDPSPAKPAEHVPLVAARLGYVDAMSAGFDVVAADGALTTRECRRVQLVVCVAHGSLTSQVARAEATQLSASRP